MANLPKTNSSPEISDAESEVANPSSPPSNHLQSHRHLRVNNVNSSFNTTIPPPPPSCAACREKLMMRRLHKQLQALEAMVPPTSRSSSPFSVIADALRYKKALKKEIQRMQRLSPQAQQVKVVKRGGDLQIKISCKKKSGLLIALMEVMESSGLVFSYVDVSCQEDIDIKALSNQGSISPNSLKIALMSTIGEFNSN